MSFPIIDVTHWKWYREEQMGSKDKLWVLDDNGLRWLFKERRHDHGEDWAEKIAAEIARALGIPHVEIELATRENRVGVISKNFLSDSNALQLEHGNALLVKRDASYPVAGPNFKVTQHTVDSALSVLQQDFITLGVFPDRPGGIVSPPEEFVGYLMLDALVGNTDRHHENWAVIVDQRSRAGASEAELAPLYDTASCLGRELTDVDRLRRLSGNRSDPTFESYWRKMRSRVVSRPRRYKMASSDRRIQARRAAPSRCRRTPGLERLNRLTDEVITDLFDAIPPDRIADPARQFGKRMVQCGKDNLLIGEEAP